MRGERLTVIELLQQCLDGGAEEADVRAVAFVVEA
jgi:hypothetical protein